MRKIIRISLWMLSSCLRSQIIRVKDIKRRAVKHHSFAYGAIQLFTITKDEGLVFWLKLHSQIGLKPIHNPDFTRLQLSVILMLIPCAWKTRLILICIIYLNCIELLKERTHKWQMMPVKLLSDFKVSPGDTGLFLCAGKQCEVRVEHKQNLISSTSGEGRKSKYY